MRSVTRGVVRARAWLVATTCAVGLATAGCGDPPAPPPNLILISIDTLRADHLGCYGYPFRTSPNLDRLAREGILFEHAYSTSSWTLPAHASMLTGLLPGEHRVEREAQGLDDSVVLLPELLASRGYRSAAVVSTVPFLTRRHGFAQGWEVYDDERAYPPPERRPQSEFVSSPTFVSSPLVVGRALELVDQLRDAPFFLFLHFFDVHAAYRAPKEFLELVREADGASGELLRRVQLAPGSEARAEEAESLAWKYDAEIRWVDSWIGRLLDELAARQLLERSLIVVTSDHGEEFFEHGAWRHHQNLFDTTLRVPLIVRLPERRFAGRRPGLPASLVDIPATLVAAAGGGPRHESGVDLVARSSRERGGAPGREIVATMLQTWTDGHQESALIAGGFKAMFRSPPLAPMDAALVGLFRVGADPLERRDLASERVNESREMERRIVSALRRADKRARTLAAPEELSLSEAERARLRSLGYL